MFTLDQLTCFQAVLDAGSLTQAAKKINRAKSAVSYNIENLESQLGFPIFHRESYRLQPTERAKIFARRARYLLDEAAGLGAFAQQLQENLETKLRVSASAIYPLADLATALKKSMELFPGCEIVFHREVLSGEKLLLQKEVDIAIFEGVQSLTQISSKKIASVSLPMVIATDHCFLAQEAEQRTFSQLLRYPQIILRSTIRDEMLSKSVEQHAIRWTVSDLDTKKELILQQLGWGRLPMHTIERELKEGRLVVLDDFAQDDHVDIYVAVRKGTRLGKVGQFLWDYF